MIIPEENIEVKYKKLLYFSPAIKTVQTRNKQNEFGHD